MPLPPCVCWKDGSIHILNDIVGKSSSLESILLALTEERRIRDIAQVIHVDSGTASNWLGRLLREDIVVRH